MRFFVTGGSGFIGSAVIRFLIGETDHQVLNFDKLTYATNPESLLGIDSSRYQFIQGDICDKCLVSDTFAKFNPDVVMHLAAETHVDRSINCPASFIQSNIVGTSTILESACEYWHNLSNKNKDWFRFHHISTDEVYGSLGNEGFFTERTPYDPSSPYSASKASSDHLVRAWYKTYGLPIVITNCSNNYGPYQFPEKLIPLTISNALAGKPLPIYGNGQQVRDWLYVDDHVSALYKVATEGVIGETYNIGGNNEKTNLEVVHTLCDLLDELHPSGFDGVKSYRNLITFVSDRPGHDQRYAIDARKISRELGWYPSESFDSGIRKTVNWHLQNVE